MNATDTDQELIEKLVECGIRGDPTLPPTRDELSHILRRMAIHHHMPLVKAVRELSNRVDTHLQTQKEWQSGINTALFDPTRGLINVRDWMMLIAKRVVIFLTGALAFAASVAVVGHNVGWW